MAANANGDVKVKVKGEYELVQNVPQHPNALSTVPEEEEDLFPGASDTLPSPKRLSSSEDDSDSDSDSLYDPAIPHSLQESLPDGAAKIEGVAAVMGPRSKIAFIAALLMMIITFGLEGSTNGSYNTYALSEFKRLSMQSSLDVADQVITAVLKLPIAKISDVIGRAEVYCFLIGFYVLSSIVHAGAPDFGIFALGSFIGILGHAGTAILNFIMISDFTSMRIRGLAGSAFFVPMILTSWLAGVIVDKVKDGIGWRWGFGMFAVIMPIGTAGLIGCLFYLQRKAKKRGFVTTHKLTARQFAEQVDAGGLALICGGFSLLLLPITIATKTKTDGQDHWKAPWVPILIILGAVLLACVIPYERYIARHPAVPIHYFRTRAIVISLLIGIFDAVSFSTTHVYLFPWSVAAHNFSPRIALYLSHSNGIAQVLTGVLVGIAMYRLRHYKQIAIVGGAVRLVGYALMIRLRRNDSSTLELFLVQVIQGIGSGMIEPTVFLSAQIVVPHAELAQVTALLAMFLHLGGGIGASIAGGIYTRNMKQRLRLRLGPAESQTEIDDLFDSITGTLPDWGTPQRQAVGAAYSDVMGYITFAALGISVPVVMFAMLMPNNRLTDGNNLAAEVETKEDLEDIPMRRAKVRR